VSTALPLRESSPLEPGVLVAERYQLIRVLGVGGMGSVWLAQDQALDSFCALKLIEADKSRDPEVRTRFAREARASAQLRGSHVVDVFDYGVWKDIPFIAMEYLVGEDLADCLARRGRLAGGTTYRIIAHVARALSRAHAQGIVHRDLKPENIFLVNSDGEEIAKVLDFGIAKHEAYSIRDRTTKLGTFLGTPFYMSPEQARGEDIDGRSDLWGLAVLTYQCLTGRLPFESEAVGKLIGQVCYDPLPIPSQRFADLPAGFDAWWRRGTERDRDRRFQTSAEAADALAEALSIPNRISVPLLARSSRQALASESGLLRVPPAATLFGVGALDVAPTEPRATSEPPRAAPPTLPEIASPNLSDFETVQRGLRDWERIALIGLKKGRRYLENRKRAALVAAAGLVVLGLLLALFAGKRSEEDVTTVAPRIGSHEAPEAPATEQPMEHDGDARKPAPEKPAEPGSTEDVPIVSAEDLPLSSAAAETAPPAAPQPAGSAKPSPGTPAHKRLFVPRDSNYGI
jgi:serine/threonine-protein kinase